MMSMFKLGDRIWSDAFIWLTGEVVFDDTGVDQHE